LNDEGSAKSKWRSDIGDGEDLAQAPDADRGRSVRVSGFVIRNFFDILCSSFDISPIGVQESRTVI
jgi:hypothetical protein